MANPYFRSYIKDNSWVVLGHALNFLKPLVLTPLILKTAGAGTFGTYILVLSLAGFVVALSSLGVDFNYRRYLPAATERATKQAIFYPQLVFHLSCLGLLGGAAFLFEAPVRKLLFNGELGFSLWLWVLYLFAYSLFNQTTTFFRYSDRMKFYMAASCIYPYLTVMFVLCWHAFFGAISVNSLIATEIGALGVVIALSGFKILREIGVAVPRGIWPACIASIRLGLPLLMVSLTDMLLVSSVRYLIAFFLSVSALGSYMAAFQLGTVILFLPRSAGVALPPLLSRAVDSGNDREAKMMLSYTVKGFFLVAIPFIVICLGMGKRLLALFATPAIAEASWRVIPIAAAGALVYGLILIFSNLLVVQLKTRVLFGATLYASALNIVLNLLGLYFFRSLIWAAVTMLLSYSLFLCIIRWELGTEWRSENDLGGLPKVFVSAVLAFLAARFMADPLTPGRGLPAVLATLILMSICYLALLLLFKTFSATELAFAGELLWSPRHSGEGGR